MAVEFTDELITYARAIALSVARSPAGRALHFDESEMVSIAYCAGVEACGRADEAAYPKTYFYRWVSGKCLNALRAERRRRIREGFDYNNPEIKHGREETLLPSRGSESSLLARETYDTVQIIGRFAASQPRRVVVLVLLVVVHGVQPQEIPAPAAETEEAMERLREWLQA